MNYSDNLSGFRQNVDCIIRQNDDTTTTRVRDTRNTTHNTGDTTMATMIDGINLTAKKNSELAAIVTRLTADEEVKSQFEFLLTFAQNIGSRKQVFLAALAINAWKHVNTTTTHTAVSPESMEWSNLEGGHTFHQVPVFKG